MKLSAVATVSSLLFATGSAQINLDPDSNFGLDFPFECLIDNFEGILQCLGDAVADFPVDATPDELCTAAQDLIVAQFDCLKICSSFSCADDGAALIGDTFDLGCGTPNFEQTCITGQFVASGEQMRTGLGLTLAAAAVALRLNN